MSISPGGFLMKICMKAACFSAGFVILLSCLTGRAAGTLKAEVKKDTWVLSKSQRRQYLHYYSPVILKRADENSRSRPGMDWITNFYFDGDDDFSNNKHNWEKNLKKHVLRGKFRKWRIRPTLYTAVIEFMDSGSKSVVLLYHVYHANNSNRSIHDWERIEIRLDDVTGSPGSGEKIEYVVITNHSTHMTRSGSGRGIRFHTTDNGRHVLLFQAEWSSTKKSPVRKGELHFVMDTVEKISTAPKAVVTTGGKGRLSWHYVFVDGEDRDAARFWKCREITRGNAGEMVSGVSLDTVPRERAIGAEYELQDIADILKTHVKPAQGENRNWKGTPVKIVLEEDSIIKNGSCEEFAPGLYSQYFYPVAVDRYDPDEKKKGYPAKHWFWGAYYFGRKGNFYVAAFNAGAPGHSRAKANGFSKCHGRYWWQHDYFVHTGVRGTGGANGEKGEWLPRGWHTEEMGGFDGRWVSQFRD